MFFIAMRFIVFSSLILRNTSSGLNVTVGILAPLTGARVLGESMYHLVEDSFLLIDLCILRLWRHRHADKMEEMNQKGRNHTFYGATSCHFL